MSAQKTEYDRRLVDLMDDRMAVLSSLTSLLALSDDQQGSFPADVSKGLLLAFNDVEELWSQISSNPEVCKITATK